MKPVPPSNALFTLNTMYSELSSSLEIVRYELPILLISACVELE